MKMKFKEKIVIWYYFIFFYGMNELKYHLFTMNWNLTYK